VLHLRTFGTLGLHDSAGVSVGSLLAQPRSMALLAYLLLARPRGYLRRDTLCALFWPDADEEHARGALSQALTRIRRSAGAQVLELRGKNEVRVAPGRFTCDVLTFEAAVSSGDLDAALSLYTGSFLAGLHVPGASGFEEWADGERDRLRSMAAQAAAELARRHMSQGRLPDAERAAARALALAPEGEAVAGELVWELWSAGDRAGALGLYEEWAATLARTLEIEPSAGLQALAGEIRAGTRVTETTPYTTSSRESTDSRPAAAPVGAPLQPPASREGELQQRAAPDEVPPARDPPPATGTPARARWRPAPRAAAGTVAGALVLLASWALLQIGALSAHFPVEAGGAENLALAPRDWLIVADFEAPSTDPALALAFQTLLIRDIESAGYASVVGGLGALSRRGLEDVLARMRLPPATPLDADLACEIAEREGAAGVLAGRVLPLGPDFVLVASVLGAGDCQELIRVSTEAGLDRLSDGITAISRELRARLGESRASIRSSPPLAPATAEYIEALRSMSEYLSEPELWHDEVRGAAKLVETLRIEPDFASAHFLLAMHYQRLGRYAQAVPHIVRSYELRDQLPRAGRLGMEAIYQRYIASDVTASIAALEGIIEHHPGVDDATLPFLADLLTWTGDWQRALDVSRTYLRRGPVGFSAHIAYSSAETAAWALGRVALADSMHQALVRASAQAGAPPNRNIALLHHFRHRDWAAAEALCARYPGWDRCGYLYLARGKLAAATAVLEPVVRDTTQQRPPWDRSAATAALAHVELLRGRPDRAWDLLQRADRDFTAVGPAAAGMHLSRFLLCAAAAELGRGRELAGCAIEHEEPADWDDDPSFAVVLRSGAWSRRLLAVRALERGDAATALEHDRLAVLSNFGSPAVVDHLIQALAFDALALPDSALARYTHAVRFEGDVGFPTAAAILLPLAPLYRRAAELAEETGDHAAALHFQRAFVALWADADPEFQPQVDAVRRRLNQAPVHGPARDAGSE
jgi:DNA-binding SARP family transcriptional activator